MCKLPKDFRESLKVHNGQKDWGLLFHDGMDNFKLYSIKEIKEEFDYRNANWQEMIEAYIETGEKFSAKSIPIYYFATGDTTCMNPKDGKLLMVSHDGDSYNLPDFKSVLKMLADYLESGRFFLNEYGLIGQLYMDETWQLIDTIPEISKKLNGPLEIFDEKEEKFADYFTKKFGTEVWRYDLNDSFWRSLSLNHNGQKTRELLFTDGEDEFEFLSYARMIEEYEEITDKYGKIVPIFKNNENGNTIFIDIFTKIYNHCKLYKYYKGRNEMKPIEKDIIDILLITYKKYKE